MLTDVFFFLYECKYVSMEYDSILNVFENNCIFYSHRRNLENFLQTDAKIDRDTERGSLFINFNSQLNPNQLRIIMMSVAGSRFVVFRQNFFPGWIHQNS